MADWKKVGDVYKSENHMDIKKISVHETTVKYTGHRKSQAVGAGSSIKIKYETTDFDGNSKRFSTLAKAKELSESFSKNEFLDNRAKRYINQKPASVSMDDYKNQLRNVLVNTGTMTKESLDDIFSRMDSISGSPSLSRGTGSTSTGKTKKGM